MRVKDTHSVPNLDLRQSTSLIFTVYISGGTQFPLAPLDIFTLITFSKHPAPWSKWRRFWFAVPLSFRHGDFHLFTTRISRVTFSKNTEIKVSLTNWRHCNVSCRISNEEEGTAHVVPVALVRVERDRIQHACEIAAAAPYHCFE
jgi:hypothetical protein